MRLTKYHIEIVTAAGNYLAEHITHHITPEDLAAHLNCSTSALQRAFKQYYQTTLYAYHLTLRLQRAKELIEEDYDSLKTIAAKTGFANASHFTKAFKKQFGISPKEYRDKADDM